MTDISWSSALSPQAPSVPRKRDWTTGTVIAILCLTGAAWWYATMDHSSPMMKQEVEERVVVALGGSAAQKIDAPPPPKDAPVVDKPPVAAERAKDAPPIAPPPEPRPVMTWTQGDGAFSSGTGGTALTPSPPPPPLRPPPKVNEPVGVSAYFTRISTARYSSLIIYPQTSLEMREEGIGILAVTIAPDGKVLDWKLVEATGKPRLDAEIKRVAGKVKQLDPLPDDFPGKRAVVQITITFKIQD